MSALRELAASMGGQAYTAVSVSSWGKWKTASQVQRFCLLLLMIICTLTDPNQHRYNQTPCPQCMLVRSETS